MKTGAATRGAFDGEHAARYDQRAAQAGWLDPDILFGLACRHVSPGQTLLDIGIGTGLASELFHRAGLRVIGLDRAPDMLALCRAKGFADELLEHDVAIAPYPLADGAAHHAICCGLLHCLDDWSVVFSETARILRRGGVLVFAVPRSDTGRPCTRRLEGRCGHPGVTLRLHTPGSVAAGIGRAGFGLVHGLRYVSAAIGGRDMDFLACLARKRGA
jgi:SAM-dependent methyltransferase